MVKFYNFTFPNVQELRRKVKRIYVQKLIPGKAIAHREDLGGEGVTFEIRGYMIGDDAETQRKQLEDLVGMETWLDLEGQLGVSTDMCCKGIIADLEFGKVAGEEKAIEYVCTIAQTTPWITVFREESFPFSDVKNIIDKRTLSETFGLAENKSVNLNYVTRAEALSASDVLTEKTLRSGSELLGLQDALSHTAGGFAIVGQAVTGQNTVGVA
jgi:hypothetical protein